QFNQLIAPYSDFISPISTLTTSLPEKPNESIQWNDLFIIYMPGKKPRYVILSSMTTISSLWEKIIIKTPFISSEHWRSHDIEVGLVNIYPETTELFLPHELNLHLNNGISFNKGCYTGQEIIARMHYRGKLKNQLQHITIQSYTEPQRGSDVDGTFNPIVDFCKKEDNYYELLIICKN